MARDLAGCLCLPDDPEKIAPLGVAEQVLQIPCQPVFHPIFGLLGVALEGLSHRLNLSGFHSDFSFLFTAHKHSTPKSPVHPRVS